MKLITIFFMTMFLASCINLKDADNAVMNGDAEKAVLSIDYTPGQVQVIKDAISEYHKFHEKWKDFIENPVVLLPDGVKELNQDYATLRDRYIEIEHIIAMNFNRYDVNTQAELLKYQKMAHEVDEDLRIVKTVRDVATYGALVAQLAAKMLGVD